MRRVLRNSWVQLHLVSAQVTPTELEQNGGFLALSRSSMNSTFPLRVTYLHHQNKTL